MIQIWEKNLIGLCLNSHLGKQGRFHPNWLPVRPRHQWATVGQPSLLQIQQVQPQPDLWTTGAALLSGLPQSLQKINNGMWASLCSWHKPFSSLRLTSLGHYLLEGEVGCQGRCRPDRNPCEKSAKACLPLYVQYAHAQQFSSSQWRVFMMELCYFPLAAWLKHWLASAKAAPRNFLQTGIPKKIVNCYSRHWNSVDNSSQDQKDGRQDNGLMHGDDEVFAPQRLFFLAGSLSGLDTEEG